MRTGVIQPLPGIGDMIWYLPALRAIAAAAPDQKITLFTRKSTQADAVMRAEPMIADIGLLPAKHRGIGGVVPNFFRTWLALVRSRPDRLFILHQSARYRIAARLAGIRDIIAYPSNVGCCKDDGWKKSLSFLEHYGICIAESVSRLSVDPKTVDAMRARFSACPEPWVVVAPGASTEARHWPVERFAACADALARKTGGTIFLIGSGRETEHIASIKQTCTHSDQMVPVINLPFDQVMGLIVCSKFLLGNDSGPANVAAALGIPAFILCGTSTPPLHSPHLHLIMPDVAQAQGMDAISVDGVLNFMRDRV